MITTYQPICQNKIHFNCGAILTADLAEIHTSHIQKSHFKSLGLGDWQEQRQAPPQARSSSEWLQGRRKTMQPGMKMWNPLGYQRRTTQLIIEMPNAWKTFQTIANTYLMILFNVLINWVKTILTSVLIEKMDTMLIFSSNFTPNCTKVEKIFSNFESQHDNFGFIYKTGKPKGYRSCVTVPTFRIKVLPNLILSHTLIIFYIICFSNHNSVQYPQISKVKIFWENTMLWKVPMT